MEDDLAKLVEVVSTPFYWEPDFWVGLVVSFVGLVFSALAFREAREAKLAASAAGTTVKIQTITIELAEIVQRIDKMDYDISFSDARDLLNEISRRLIRLTAPFKDYEDLSGLYERLRASLEESKESLQLVRPSELDDEDVATNSVYFGMQGHFSDISSLVAEIMGMFEKRTIDMDAA